MALEFLNSRVSFLGVGVPGFSTSGNQVLRVNGGLGVDTTSLRAQVDVPRISIRGDIVDAAEETGGLGYFLSQDSEGVKWANVNPLVPFSIYVSQDNVQVGLSSFTGFNFFTPGEPNVLRVKADDLNPSIARISVDVRFSKQGISNGAGTGTNFYISTGFGADGTYASIPGYGTSEAVGLVSIGIGTNRPKADLQVGVGSTGVEIFGPEGRINAEVIQVKSLEVEDNLRVNSLIVEPGIATFIGSVFLDNQSFITTSITNIGVVTGNFTVGPTTDQFNRVVGGGTSLGFTTIGYTNNLFPPEGGVGLGTTGPALVVTGVTTFNGLTTTNFNLFVGNDLFVNGETFFNQINADNLLVTGVATVNQTQGVGASFIELNVSGLTTFNDFTFNSGIGTDLNVTGVVTAVDANITGIATIGFLTVTDGVFVGFATISDADIGFASITEADVGILTARDLTVTGVSTLGFATIGVGTTGSGLYAVGINTFDNGPKGTDTTIGFSTFTNDLYIGNDVFVGGILNIDQINGENLLLSGVATISELRYNIGFGTTANIENLFYDVGIGTTSITGFSSIGFATVGVATIRRLDAEFIKTRDLEVTGFSTIRAGIFTDLQVTGVTTLGIATIGVGTTGSGLYAVGINTFDNGPKGTDTTIGFSTFTNDLYVGNDLFVGGELNFDQLTGKNLLVTGVATIFELRFNVGFGTTANIENLNYNIGIGTTARIENLFYNQGIGTFSNITGILTATDVNVSSAATIQRANITNLFAMDANIDDLNVNTGFATFFDFTNTNTGIATIGFATIRDAGVGVLTVYDYLEVVGPATFRGDVRIEDFAFINQEVTGVSSINQLRFNNGIGTDLTVRDDFTFNRGIGTDLNVTGVATVGFATITDGFIGFATVGFLTVGTSTQFESLYSIGTAFFDAGGSGIIDGVGYAITTKGDVFIDGDLDVTGDINIPSFDVEDLTVGVITVRERIDARGKDGILAISSFTDVIIERNLDAQGISTLGDKDTVGASATFYPDGRVFVGGTATFNNLVNFNNNIFTPDDNSLTGIVTLGRTDATIGFVTTRSDLFIGSDLYVKDELFAPVGFITDLTVSGVATIQNLGFTSGIGTNLEVTGISTLGFASIGGASTTNGALYVAGVSSFMGFTTFRNDVFITGKLFVDDALVFDDLEATTFRVVSIGTAKDFQVTDNFKVGVGSTQPGISTFVGFATFGSENNLTGAGYSQRRSLYSTGISTFAGIGSFIGTEGDGSVTAFVYIDGDLEVNGNLDIPNLDIDDLQVGVLTVTEFADINNLFVTGDGITDGITTLTRLEYQVGFGTTSNVDRLNFNVGIGTSLKITEDLIVDRNLDVTGLSTFRDVLTVGIISASNELVEELRIESPINGVGFDVEAFGVTATSIIGLTNISTNPGQNNITLESETGEIFLVASDPSGGLIELETPQVNITGNSGTPGNLNVVGVSTFTDVNITGIVTTVKANVTDELTFNVGIGTSLRLDDLNVVGTGTVGLVSATGIEVGVITGFKADFNEIEVDFLSIEDLVVTGFATVTAGIITDLTISGVTTTKRLDFSDFDDALDNNFLNSEFSVEVQTNTNISPVLLVGLATEYKSFEFTIQGTEGSRFQTSKIMGIADDNPTPNIFFTEYSSVFNASPVGSFNIVGSLNEIQLQVQSNTSNPTDYIVRVNATRRTS